MSDFRDELRKITAQLARESVQICMVSIKYDKAADWSVNELSRVRNIADRDITALINNHRPEKRVGLTEIPLDNDNPSEGMTMSCAECGGYDECDCDGYNEAIDDFFHNLLVDE